MAQAEQSQARSFPVIVGSPILEWERWVRVKFAGTVIADSKQVLLLRQYGPGKLPTYFFAPAAVRLDLLVPAAERGDPNARVKYWSIKVGDQVAENAAWSYQNPKGVLDRLDGMITFVWDKPVTWYEEEEAVFAHPRDPYHRVDVLESSRHVQVAIAGVTLADTRRPCLLFESSLPTRYYLPREDVRMDLLTPTDLSTQCPYKGTASYWSATAGETVKKNVAWSYQDPVRENPLIKDLICFYNERVDLTVDGVLQPRPITPWSE